MPSENAHTLSRSYVQTYYSNHSYDTLIMFANSLTSFTRPSAIYLSHLPSTLCSCFPSPIFPLAISFSTNAAQFVSLFSTNCHSLLFHILYLCPIYLSIPVSQLPPSPSFIPFPLTQWGRPSPVVSIKVPSSRVQFRVLQVNLQTTPWRGAT